MSWNDVPTRLADLDTEWLAQLLADDLNRVLLFPVGSTEPHGPHLPLATDSILSDVVADDACAALRKKGFGALVAPTLPYGVTDYAAGFAGGASVPATVLTELVVSLARGWIGEGWTHVAIVNNHLEPAHVEALLAAVEEVGPALSLPNVLDRRWALTLGDEFRSGACHAGRYEGSLVLAAREDLVDEETMVSLPENATSLSKAIRNGQTTFLEAGGDRAYFGAPARATAAEGERLFGRLVDMVVTEVGEAFMRR